MLSVQPLCIYVFKTKKEGSQRDVSIIISSFFSLQYIVASELEQLFVKQSSMEVYFEWLDSLIERRVSEVRPSLHRRLTLGNLARVCLVWTLTDLNNT